MRDGGRARRGTHRPYAVAPAPTRASAVKTVPTRVGVERVGDGPGWTARTCVRRIVAACRTRCIVISNFVTGTRSKLYAPASFSGNMSCRHSSAGTGPAFRHLAQSRDPGRYLKSVMRDLFPRSLLVTCGCLCPRIKHRRRLTVSHLLLACFHDHLPIPIAHHHHLRRPLPRPSLASRGHV